MKQVILFIVMILVSRICPLLSQNSNQENNYEGIVTSKIYSNFNYQLNSPESSTSFALTRAYFGYERQLSEHFSANVKLDVGSPEDLSEFSRINRYAYFKNAGICYSNGPFTAWGGLFDMTQFKTQENFWGYRYLYKSYMDEYRFGPSADLGVGMKYRFSKIETDFTFTNGEGYSSPQRDDNYKAGWGLTYMATETLILRGYYSLFLVETPQMTFTGFAGYNSGSFSLGVEYNHQLNYRFNEDRNRYGYSTYSTYTFSEKWEIFLRYDHLFSNLVGDSQIPWNLPEDGSALIGGVQYTPINNIHLTLDYQDWVEYAGNGQTDQILYIHLEANF